MNAPFNYSISCLLKLLETSVHSYGPYNRIPFFKRQRTDFYHGSVRCRLQTPQEPTYPLSSRFYVIVLGLYWPHRSPVETSCLYPAGMLPIDSITRLFMLQEKIEKGIFSHLLGILSHIFLYWISLYGQEDALSSWIAPKSGVLRLFLLRHEHCDSQSWVIMRLESENGSNTILTLYPCAHLPTSFLPFLLLGWDAMTKATHRREFIGVYSSRVQSLRIMSGIMVAGRHGADIVNWELISWSTSRRPFRERPWE